MLWSSPLSSSSSSSPSPSFSSHGKVSPKLRADPKQPLSTVQPPLHANPTVQPRLGLRARSSTSPHRTNPKSKHPPLHLHLPTAAHKVSEYPEQPPSLAESPSEKSSAPIDIPIRKSAQGRLSFPTTPLTARAPQGDYFTTWCKAEPRISDSLTPCYSSRTKNPSYNQDPSAPPRGFTQMSPRSESSSYRPSSPFCSQISAPLSSTNNGQKGKLAAQLPKYHPANFPSRGSSPTAITPPSLLSSRSRSIASQPRSGRGSDPQQQLLQYQRDVLNSTAKFSRSLLSSSVSSNLSPPRLNPLRSPAGPMTPFMLDGPSDYLAAGSSSLPIASKEGDTEESVERLVCREDERSRHPEARSGSVSPTLCLSPAVSPAGVRG